MHFFLQIRGDELNYARFWLLNLPSLHPLTSDFKCVYANYIDISRKQKSTFDPIYSNMVQFVKNTDLQKLVPKILMGALEPKGLIACQGSGKLLLVLPVCPCASPNTLSRLNFSGLLFVQLFSFCSCPLLLQTAHMVWPQVLSAACPACYRGHLPPAWGHPRQIKIPEQCET